MLTLEFQPGKASGLAGEHHQELEFTVVFGAHGAEARVGDAPLGEDDGQAAAHLERSVLLECLQVESDRLGRPPQRQLAGGRDVGTCWEFSVNAGRNVQV